MDSLKKAGINTKIDDVSMLVEHDMEAFIHNASDFDFDSSNEFFND